MIPMDFVMIGDRCTAAELKKLLAFDYTKPRAVCLSREFVKTMPWSKDQIHSLEAVCKDAGVPFYMAHHLYWKEVK